MADGQAPDQTQALLQMQSLIASANGTQGKAAPIIAALLPGGGRDVNVGQGTSIQGGGFKFDATFRANAQARPGLIESLKQQLGLKGNQLFDDIKKCGQGVTAMYSGDLPNGSLPGAGGSGLAGGSFASNVGPSSGSDVGIG